MKDPNMIKNVIGLLQLNLEMLKSMSAMMEPNNPMAFFLDKSSPVFLFLYNIRKIYKKL